MKSNDCLHEMFKLREKFMHALVEKNPEIYPTWPVDVRKKRSQQALRDTALKGVEEIFESLAGLKNWKSHRTTEDDTFDREHFLEEMVDAFNYFFSVLVLAGVSADELFNAYVKKDKVIHNRLKTGY